ncbi:L,D-transpeptidase family protein [Methylomagnum sp.]
MSRNQKQPTHAAGWGSVRWAVALLALGTPFTYADVPLNEAVPIEGDAPAVDYDIPASQPFSNGGDSLCTHGGARSLTIFPGSDLVGENRFIPALPKDSLYDIACRYNVGVEEIFLANDPLNIDHWLPGDGTKVLIPQHFVLPDAPRAGIVVNIPEMRLYFYPVKYAPIVKKAPPPKPKPAVAKAKPGAKGKPGDKGKPAVVVKAPPPPPPKPVEPTEVGEPLGPAGEVISFPISMGRMDWRTPVGKTRIAAKVKDPTWTPPESIRREHAAKGDILPAVVPAGPENPLGRFAMRLGVPGYLIHGTEANFKSFGIGLRVTHGCMRMYNEDVARLFPMVSVGTPVYLVNQPVKLGWQGDKLYMEVSRPLDEDSGIPPEKPEEDMTEAELAREDAKTPEQIKAEEKRKDQIRAVYLQRLALDLIQKAHAKRPILLDREAVRKAVASPTGLPVEIGKAEPPPPPPMEALPETYPPTQVSPPPTPPASQYPSAPPRYPYGGAGQPVPRPPVPGAYGGVQTPRPAPPPAQPGQTLQYPYGTGQAAPRYENRPATPSAQSPYGSTPPPSRTYPPQPYGTAPEATPAQTYSPDQEGAPDPEAPDPYAPDDEEPTN